MKNMIENMSRNTKISIGVIVLVIIVALIVRFNGDKKANLTELAPEVPVVAELTQAPKKARVTKKVDEEVVAPEVVVDTRNYTELILAYKDRTLQFGDLCHVRMSNQAYKAGEQILLDNRNNFPVSIKIGMDTYELPSYGFKVVSLNTEGEFMVDCAGYENVATVTVQK